MKAATLISLFLVFYLLEVVPRSAAADNDVKVDACSEDETNKKDMECAHAFLNAVTGSNVNCSVELKRFKDCFKTFMMDRCYSDYLRTHQDKRKTMERMADMKSEIHNFGGLLCGVAQGPANMSGLPPDAKVPKCKEAFFQESKLCAQNFHGKFVMNRNSTDLCSLYMKAKGCIGESVKKHCEMHKPRRHDKFNPFCPNREDPRKGGAIKAYFSSTLAIVPFIVYLLF